MFCGTKLPRIERIGAGHLDSKILTAVNKLKFFETASQDYGLNQDDVIASHGYVSQGLQEEKLFLALHGNDSGGIC